MKTGDRGGFLVFPKCIQNFLIYEKTCGGETGRILHEIHSDNSFFLI